MTPEDYDRRRHEEDCDDLDRTKCKSWDHCFPDGANAHDDEERTCYHCGRTEVLRWAKK
jgi:hypothetical protein